MALLTVLSEDFLLELLKITENLSDKKITNYFSFLVSHRGMNNLIHQEKLFIPL